MREMILDVPWGVQVLLIKNRRNPQILFLAYIICLWQFFMDTERAHTPQLLYSPSGCEQCQSYGLLLLSNLTLASPLPGLALQLEWEHSELRLSFMLNQVGFWPVHPALTVFIWNYSPILMPTPNLCKLSGRTDASTRSLRLHSLCHEHQ